MATCFISYSQPDISFVEEELVGLLRALGVGVWYSRDSIITAEEWERSILQGLKSSDWFVLVMSPSSQGSRWVRDELAWAIAHREGHIIPVLIQPCELSAFHIRVSTLQVLSYVEEPARARQKLIELIVNATYKAPARRTAAITGNWAAEFHQVRGPDGTPLDYSGELTLAVSGPNITGEMTASVPLSINAVEIRFRFTAGFFHDRFLQLSYVASDPKRIQFGAAILQLDDAGNSMDGMFIGYGAFSRAIINGTLKLRKID